MRRFIRIFSMCFALAINPARASAGVIVLDTLELLPEE